MGPYAGAGGGVPSSRLAGLARAEPQLPRPEVVPNTMEKHSGGVRIAECFHILFIIFGITLS